MEGAGLSALPSSEIRVIEQSSQRLVVLDPPAYFAGLLVVAISLFGFALFIALRHRHSSGTASLMTMLSTTPILFMGLALLTSKTVISADVESARVTVQHRVFGLVRGSSDFELSDVDSVEVFEGTGKQTGLRSLSLILVSGDAFPVGNYSSQGGHNAVARAMNSFIAEHRKFTK
jgi:hypothetical protein